MSAPQPVWLVTYEGTDVTDELQSMITSSEYTDHVTGQSDELQLTLEDREGRWREGWFPSEGDRLRVQFGYLGQALIDSGEFQVDEPELSGPPSTIAIRALAVPVTSDLRTAKSRAFEETTLRALLELLARELELELLGEVPEVPILRVAQSNVSTLAFIRNLAREYGYAFTIRPPQLVFYSLAELGATPAAFRLDESDLTHYSLKAATQSTYAACEVRWYDPSTNDLRTAIVYADHARQRIIIGGQTDGLAENLTATEPPQIPTRILQHLTPMQKGEDVRQWQVFLQGQGHEPGPIDGKFGPLSRKATMAFQRAQGLTIDGKAGPETFRVAVDCGYGRPGGLQDGGPTRAEVAGPVLRKEIRVESVAQAQLMAQAFLTEANRLRASGSLEFPGNARALAGATVEVTGLGRMSGKYLIESAKHPMTRDGGWKTSVEVTYV